jgi:hypothetical protein
MGPLPRAGRGLEATLPLALPGVAYLALVAPALRGTAGPALSGGFSDGMIPGG